MLRARRLAALFFLTAMLLGPYCLSPQAAAKGVPMEWLNFFATLVSGFAGGCVVYWLAERKTYKTRPILSIVSGDSDEFKKKVPIDPSQLQMGNAYQIRVRITNTGKRPAKNCAVFLTDVQKSQDQKWASANYSDTLQIDWGDASHRDTMDLFPGIPYWIVVIVSKQQPTNSINNFEYCTPNTIIQLSYPPKFDETLVYRFIIQAAADDADPVCFPLCIKWEGQCNNMKVLQEQEVV